MQLDLKFVCVVISYMNLYMYNDRHNAAFIINLKAVRTDGSF